MPEKNQFDLSTSAAESYQRQKVPALFAPLAEATLNSIKIPKQADVLDVACGTGAVARAVADRLAAPSWIVGADLNPAMIEIARRETPPNLHRETPPGLHRFFNNRAYNRATVLLACFRVYPSYS